MHIKHEAFAKEPITEISKVVAHLFIMSFNLRNAQGFINHIRRNSKLYPFIHATHYNNVTFCCIDRTKIKNKKDVLTIFAPFL